MKVDPELALVVSVLATSLPGRAAPAAQAADLVVPARYAGVEAESFTGIPFGRSTAVRAQLWYGPNWFAGKRTWTAVAFRPDGGKGFAAKTVDVEIFLATGPRQLAGVGSRFAGNRGADFRNVFRRRKVRLPAVTAATGPRPFAAVFTLDRGFAYDPGRGGLVVEVVVHGQQPGRWEVDLGRLCTSARASFGRPGCRGSNGKIPVADTPTRALVAGQGFVLRVRDLLPMGPVAVLLGTIETGRWMGLQIPYAMDAIGARGCALNTDIALALPAAAGVSGEARVPGRLPPLPGLVGSWLRFQGLALDRRANALGLTASQGSKTRICGPNPLARILATDLLARTGQVDRGAVPVTRFTSK